MGGVFVCTLIKLLVPLGKTVSVPFGDLFYLYNLNISMGVGTHSSFRPLWGSFLFVFAGLVEWSALCLVSVPFGDLFCFYENHEDVQADSNSGFRPLWGAFLFLYTHEYDCK